jgi:pheromone a factor receptor
MNIYTFYEHQREFMTIMTSSHGLNRGRYFRLMALSATEMLGSVPLGTYIIVANAEEGVTPWKSWADTHYHYSTVNQFPGFIWKNQPDTASSLEMFRWSLVACGFIFFAFFGFADEARQHYRLVYAWFYKRIMGTAPPGSVPPDLPDTPKLTVGASSGIDEV